MDRRPSQTVPNDQYAKWQVPVKRKAQGGQTAREGKAAQGKKGGTPHRKKRMAAKLPTGEVEARRGQQRGGKKRNISSGQEPKDACEEASPNEHAFLDTRVIIPICRKRCSQ